MKDLVIHWCRSLCRSAINVDHSNIGIFITVGHSNIGKFINVGYSNIGTFINVGHSQLHVNIETLIIKLAL